MAGGTFSTLRESRGCETDEEATLHQALDAFSTLRESRGCETQHDAMTLIHSATFSTLRESRGCETYPPSGCFARVHHFQYSPRVEGV